ncbi:MAG: right-handed parallel beta-helix repeat-containing protein [Clostridiales bacterium]|nr:right-handed parallel beta-helix repeat-containing protein [Clostridiales bacterium]
MMINASEYGVKPNKEIGKELSALFKKMAETEGEKTVVFETGSYFVDAENCDTEMLYITNTAGDNEYKSSETPHQAKVVFNLKNIKDLKIEGNGARFVINGKATNAAIQGCENIEINNIEIDYDNPDLHELTVINIGKHYVDFEIDENTKYEFRKGKFYFIGTGYETNLLKTYKVAWHLSRVREEDINTIERTRNIISTLFKIKDLGNRKIRMYYIKPYGFKMGDRYCFFGRRRQYAGIFSDKTKNLTLNHVAQRFNYSLAFVAQDTENITLNGLDFSPSKETGRLMASAADFLQICMCRGKVSITNSKFEGACDDCLNVHGVHFKIVKAESNTITVKFMHKQSHGYNPIRVDDEVAFIDSKSLLEKGTAKVISSKLINENEIEIQLKSMENAVEGDVIEDITACPELDFKNNTVNRIATRAVLITNRPKTVVEGNHFNSNSMSGISIADDAQNWFESGMCKDVVIKDNVFEYCGDTPIRIIPENRVHKGAIHSNIKILNNTFKKYEGTCITIKSTENIEIKGNTFNSEDRLKTTNCTNIDTDF